MIRTFEGVKSRVPFKLSSFECLKGGGGKSGAFTPLLPRGDVVEQLTIRPRAAQMQMPWARLRKEKGQNLRRDLNLRLSKIDGALDPQVGRSARGEVP